MLFKHEWARSMKERNLTEPEVFAFSKRQESHFYDRKAKEVSGKKIQKIAVAFANADGGDFVVGIKDDKDELDYRLRWDGANDKEFFNTIFQNFHQITPRIPYSAEFMTDNQKKQFVSASP